MGRVLHVVNSRLSVIQLADEKALARYLEHPRRLAYIEEYVAPLTEDRIELDIPSDGPHPVNLLLAALALFVAIERFGPHSLWAVTAVHAAGAR
jgi:hypothetical protein